ncbi:MAG: hypothetical protein M3130_08125 [Actinomycetota bacterium]|nr:hypothetical protein [Actinomycetota bacterium]
MRSALAYEMTRIRTIRSTWWLSGMAVVVGVGISTLFSWAISSDFHKHGVHQSDLNGLGAAVVTQLGASGGVPSIVGFLLAMIGIFAWGHEYRHGMIRASLTALNSRPSFWVAKYLVCAVWVLVVALVTMLLSGLAGSIFLHSYVHVFQGLTWSIIGRELVYVVLLTWLAMAFTSLTRSQAFALVAIFLWPLLVESLFHVFFMLVPGLRDHTSILRFLPFEAGNQMINVLSHPASTFGDPLTALGGTIVFGGLAVVLMVGSFVLFGRRDA